MKEEIKNIVDEARQELSAYKCGCVDLFHVEFKEINWSAFSEKYFERTSSWIQKKFAGCVSPNREKPFTPEEYEKLSASLRNMAERLNYYADLIDKAEN